MTHRSDEDSLSKRRPGRPGQGRRVRLQVLVTPDLEKWLAQQCQPGETVSTAIYRLLDEQRRKEQSA